MPFFKIPVICKNYSVDYCTENRVLFFEENRNLKVKALIFDIFSGNGYNKKRYSSNYQCFFFFFFFKVKENSNIKACSEIIIDCIMYEDPKKESQKPFFVH